MNGYDFNLRCHGISSRGETDLTYSMLTLYPPICARLTSRHLHDIQLPNDVESWEIINFIQDFPRIINCASDVTLNHLSLNSAISLAQASTICAHNGLGRKPRTWQPFGLLLRNSNSPQRSPRLGVEAQTRCKPYLKRPKGVWSIKKNSTHGVELLIMKESSLLHVSQWDLLNKVQSYLET